MGERVGKKHKFMLRIDANLHHENEAICLNRDMSMNLLLNEMIMFAKASSGFQDYLDKHYPIDDRRGHYVYIRGDY